MEELTLPFFPFPHVFHGKRRNGSMMDWPSRCQNCDKQCESSTARDVQLCSYGLNYLRITDELLVAGIALRDYAVDTTARRKMLRNLQDQLVSAEHLQRVADRARVGIDAIERELNARFEMVVKAYRESRSYHEEIVEQIRPEMELALAQVHDYKQFVRQISQNMDVLLEEKYPGCSRTDKIERANHEEAAIYSAAEMMDEKLEAVAFLQFPERISEISEQRRFRLHGMVLKYVRIYQRKADQRNLNISMSGKSWANIEGNARALGIIPHTLIDNAIKYAPENTEIDVLFKEEGNYVDLTVRSFGPRITESERETIFDPFVRGRAARDMRIEGTGFGLAAAQAIARAHGTNIVVQQGGHLGPENTYRTRFEVRFARAG